MRHLGLALVVLAVGCAKGTKPFDDPQGVANLKAQATEVGHAMTKPDHARMVELTHPTLVQHFGGPDGFLKKLHEVDREMRSQGLKFGAFELGTPSKLVESGGEVYAVLPYTLDATGPNGEQITQPSYLVCCSSDRGANWKFLDGAGVGGDRKKLKQVLPKFPDELRLPAPREPRPR